MIKYNKYSDNLLEVLRAANAPLAVHEIGVALRNKGIYYNDPGISAHLRKPISRSGIRELVFGITRPGTHYKEWRLI